MFDKLILSKENKLLVPMVLYFEKLNSIVLYTKALFKVFLINK